MEIHLNHTHFLDPQKSIGGIQGRYSRMHRGTTGGDLFYFWGTESDNWAIKGSALVNEEKGP